MRKSLWVLALASSLAAGCSRVTHIPPMTAMTTIDVSAYARQGFLFTPGVYPSAYTSLGAINLAHYAEGDLRANPRGVQEWQFQPIAVQDMLRDAHRAAREMGADAIMEFQLRAITRQEGAVTVPGIELTGFAIRRGTTSPTSTAPSP